MLPNNIDFMYRYAQSHIKEIQSEVDASRGGPFDAHILRRRIAVVVGVGLVGLTLVLAIVMLGWWVL